MLLGEMELVMLLKTCANVAPMQDFELGPVLCQLLHETALRQNGAGPSGLLVLRAGRSHRGNLTLLECLVELVELCKNDFPWSLGTEAAVCDRIVSNTSAFARRWRRLSRCLLISAVVVLQDVLLQENLPAKRGGIPGR